MRRQLLGTRAVAQLRPGASIAELRQITQIAVARTELDASALAIAAEFYGLTGYPSRLAGADSLVRRVATPSPNRRPKPASRSTIAALIKSATEKIEAAIELPEGFVMPSGPEPDPMTRGWVRSPPALGRRLSATELQVLCLAAYEASFDFVCRSEHAAQLQEALRRWAEVNAGVGPSTSRLRGSRLEPERRNAAHAVLAIALWDIVHDEQQLAAALAGDPVIAWCGVEKLGLGGRVAEHPRWGVMTSDLDPDEFVLLADEVMEWRDAGGRAADLLLDVVRQDRHLELFDSDTAETVLWAVGYGLASVGSWKTIELARHYHRHEPRSLTTVSVMAWSAHVASLHLHDGLAWRLASGADRLLERLPSVRPVKQAGVLWQTNLIRSGCRVREADRWREHDYWTNAHRSLQESMQFLRLAEQHAQAFDSSTRLSKQLSLQLRHAEILWVSHMMRIDGHPAKGFVDEGQRFSDVLRSIGVELNAAEDDELDHGDRDIFASRLALLKAARRDFLDDPPPGLPTS